MASVFSLGVYGKVKQVMLPDVYGLGLVTIEPNIDAISVVITKFQVDYGVHVQFQKTLQQAVYAYTFGDNMGDVIIGGLAFFGGCGSGIMDDENPVVAGEPAAANTSGMKQVLEYYLKNKMSTRTSPITITFADQKIEGYLVGCQLSTADPSTYSCGFTFVLKVGAPEK
jgi:hypothetical protein